jgi:glutamate-1-semialdehyde 2,1-aminomutase
MLSEGVYLPPSQFEAAFLSMAHDDVVLEDTLQAARLAFAALAG